MNGFTTIAADGSQLAAGATDHVATLDQTTNLMWAVADLGELNFDDAAKACAGLELAGFNDWRLPTVTELFGLVDHEKFRPAIDSDAFPGTKSDWYWTSTDVASSSVYAWLVGFYDGHVGDGHRSFRAFVRAVRVAAPAGQ